MKFYAARATALLFLVKILSKLFFVEMPAIPSVSAIIMEGDKLLFIDLSYKKGLALPGGIINPGENAQEALKREIKEETGLEVVSSKYVGTVATATRGIGSLSIVFKVRAQGNLKNSDEGRAVWLTKEEVSGKLAYRNNEIALKKFFNSSSLS